MVRLLDIFRKEESLIGTAVAGRFHVQSLVHEDEFSRLYVGTDIVESNTIGVRTAITRRNHTKMLDWLAQAMMTSGKHAIMAIGHLPNDVLYVVLSEAALDIVRLPQDEIPNNNGQTLVQ